jgi:transglutaminase-like putative cysteine protease
MNTRPVARRRDLRHVEFDAIAIIGVLSVVATLGFRGVFPDWSFLPAAIVGAAGASAVTIATRGFRLRLGESVLASVVGFGVLGGVAAEGLPTPAAYVTFVDGLVNGWAQVLSSVPPAELVGEYRVLPYTVAWLGALIGGELLRWSRATGAGAAGPMLGLALATLITLEDRTVALAQGAVLGVGALLLGFVQHRRRTAEHEIRDDHAGSWHEHPLVRTAGAVGFAAVIAVSAVIIGPRLPAASAHDRFDLREYQTPPFDPLDEPTPLGQLKVGLQDANADRVVMKVTSTEPFERITLAVLDTYSGEFWQVGDERIDSRAQFRPVDSVFPTPADGTIDDWERQRSTIEIVDLDRLAGGEFDPVWLPSPGWPVSVGSEADLDLRFNAGTGTIAVAPDGTDAGLVFDIVTATPPDIDDLALQSAGVTLREPTDLAVPQIRSFAADVLEGADVGWEQVEAIRSRLVDTGAYDSRAASSTARPGHHLGRLAEFVDDPEAIVGFEEQYAALAALVARSEGLPARVAVGFVVPEDELADRTAGDTVSVLADDITAWIEVRFDDVGWLPFDVTPPRDREPQDTPVGRTEREVAIPNPPPEPPPPVLPPDLDLDTELEDEPEDEPEEEPTTSGGLPVRAIVIATAIGFPILLVAGVLIAIVVLKRRRTTRRRAAAEPSHRVAGAWFELLDTCTEQGVSVPRTATNQEIARGVAETHEFDDPEVGTLTALASDVDRAAFHPAGADDRVAETAWERSDRLRATLIARRSPTRRVVDRFDPRPLRRHDPLRHVTVASSTLVVDDRVSTIDHHDERGPDRDDRDHHDDHDDHDHRDHDHDDQP